MKKLAFITIILLLKIVVVYSQSITKLQDKNGFQDLKLGENISKYVDFKPIAECGIENEKTWGGRYDLMYVGSKYKNIGELKILNVFINLYENRIREIDIRCEYNSILIHSTIANFGEPNGWIYNDDKFESGKAMYGFMTWESKDVKLILYYKNYYNKYDSKSSTIPDFMSLVYNSKLIEKEISSKKNFNNLKKIDKAANDY